MLPCTSTLMQIIGPLSKRTEEPSLRESCPAPIQQSSRPQPPDCSERSLEVSLPGNTDKVVTEGTALLDQYFLKKQSYI